MMLGRLKNPKKKKKIQEKNGIIFDLPPDCVSLITNYFNSAFTFFSTLYSCKHFYQIFVHKEFFGCKNLLFHLKAISEEELEEPKEPKEPKEITLFFVRGITFPNEIDLEDKQEITLKRFRRICNQFINLEYIEFNKYTSSFKDQYDLLNNLSDCFKDKLKRLDCSVMMDKKINEIFANEYLDLSKFRPFNNIESLKVQSKYFNLGTFDTKIWRSIKQLEIEMSSFWTIFFNTTKTKVTFENTEILGVNQNLSKIQSLKSLSLLEFNSGIAGINKIKNVRELAITFASVIEPYISTKKAFSGMNKLRILRLKGHNIDNLWEEEFIDLPKLDLLEIEIRENNNKNLIPASFIFSVLKNNKIKKLKIGNAHVSLNKIDVKSLHKLQTDTLFSICCREYCHLKDLFTKKIYFYDMEASPIESKWIAFRCKNCKDCACGSELDSLIICSECRKVGCKNCMNYCSWCNSEYHCSVCVLPETPIQKCEVCKKSNKCYDDSHVSNCGVCGKEVCRNCSMACASGCPLKYCKDCMKKVEIIHCDTCKTVVGCKHCSFCRFCEEKICENCNPGKKCFGVDSNFKYHLICQKHYCDTKELCFSCLHVKTKTPNEKLKKEKAK